MNLDQALQLGATVNCGAVDLNGINLGELSRGGDLVLNDRGAEYLAQALAEAEGPQVAEPAPAPARKTARRTAAPAPAPAPVEPPEEPAPEA